MPIVDAVPLQPILTREITGASISTEPGKVPYASLGVTQVCVKCVCASLGVRKPASSLCSQTRYVWTRTAGTGDWGRQIRAGEGQAHGWTDLGRGMGPAYIR